jgi:integrase/recombinase XerD
MAMGSPRKVKNIKGMKKLTLKNQAFIELLASYKNWLDVLGYAESTVYNLPNHLREFFHFLERHGHSDISRITTKLIQDYYKELAGRTNQRRGGGLSKAFLNKHQQALKKFLIYLKEHNVNIQFGVHLRGEKIEYHTKDKVILTQDEMKLLFESCSISHMSEHFQMRDRAILVLAYSCGLRRNEMVHVNTEDILFEKQRIYVRKGKNYKERFVPINKYNLQLLEDYLYEGRPEFQSNYQTDALLLSQFGKRINDMSIANRLKAIIEATEDETIQGKHITLHTLRHSIATHLLQNNVPMKSISQFLGHASMESTQIYTHLVKSISQ